MFRKLWTTLAVAACGMSLAFCGGTTNKAGPDAGKPSTPRDASGQCIDSFDCNEGDCVKGACVKCTAGSCAPGQTCSGDLKCVGCDGGGCGGDAASPKCATRDDCPSGQVCHSTKCQPPDSTGRCLVNDECVAGQVCNFSSNTCIVGCFSNADCKGVYGDGGVAFLHCDNAVTNQCGPCVDSGDCALGETCNKTSGVCEKAPECVPPDRTPCGERACISKDGGGYTCGPCTLASECGTGYDCTAGKCVTQQTGCKDDSQCKIASPGHWCDKSSGQCEWGCLPNEWDAGTCATGHNCCNADAGDSCNGSTHLCSSGSCTDCNPACGMNEVCDTSTCTCRTGTGEDGGTTTGGCDPDKCTGCPSGQTCKCGMAAGASMFSCGQLGQTCNNNFAKIVLEAFCE